MAYQSVYKWVDSGIEQYQRVNNGVCGLTSAERCVVVYTVGNYVRYPTDSKYGSDSYNHQGDSLPHSQDTLCIKGDANPLNLVTTESGK